MATEAEGGVPAHSDPSPEPVDIRSLSRLARVLLQAAGVLQFPRQRTGRISEGPIITSLNRVEKSGRPSSWTLPSWQRQLQAS